MPAGPALLVLTKRREAPRHHVGDTSSSQAAILPSTPNQANHRITNPDGVPTECWMGVSAGSSRARRKRLARVVESNDTRIPASAAFLSGAVHDGQTRRGCLEPEFDSASTSPQDPGESTIG